MVKQPLQCGRREEERHVDGQTHDGSGEIDFVNSRKHIGYQITVLVGLRVALIGDFVIGRAINVMKDGAG